MLFVKTPCEDASRRVDFTEMTVGPWSLSKISADSLDDKLMALSPSSAIVQGDRSISTVLPMDRRCQFFIGTLSIIPGAIGASTYIPSFPIWM